jgi:hypothetical protein
MSERGRTPDNRDAFRFLVSPYHPDSLRYPVSVPVTTPAERVRHALTWNVFKTLEQVAPSLWMRLLIARCVGLPENYDSAPQIARVACWPHLKPAPSSVLRRGRVQSLSVNVVIDTDDTVVTLLTPGPSELLDRVLSESAADGVVSVAEATAWLAGTRSAYVSVVLPVESDGHEWIDRVRARAERSYRFLSAQTRAPQNLRGIGVGTWPMLHEVLTDVESSSFIEDSERRLVRTTRSWMQERLGTVDRDRQRLA